jgi:hypothetical protein
MTYKVDDDTIWEDTGKVIVYNYPPSAKTTSYIARIYREIKKSSIDVKEVRGKPFLFYDLPQSLRTLATIIGECQAELCESLPREQFLKEIKP